MSVIYREDEPDTGINPAEFEVSPSWEELMVLCIDISWSMKNDHKSDKPGHSRIDEVTHHLFDQKSGLFRSLSNSKHRQAFWLMVMVFDEKPNIVMQPTKLIAPDGRSSAVLVLDDATRDLLEPRVKKTDLSKALYLAENMAGKWIQEQTKALPRLATIAVISDGHSNASGMRGMNVQDLASEIKKYAGQVSLADMDRDQIVIACAAYGGEETGERNWDLLKELASSPEFFVEAKNGRQLRDFLIASAVTRLKQ